MSETITLADLAAGKNRLSTEVTVTAGDVMQVAGASGDFTSGTGSY